MRFVISVMVNDQARTFYCGNRKAAIELCKALKMHSDFCAVNRLPSWGVAECWDEQEAEWVWTLGKERAPTYVHSSS